MDIHMVGLIKSVEELVYDLEDNTRLDVGELMNDLVSSAVNLQETGESQKLVKPLYDIDGGGVTQGLFVFLRLKFTVDRPCRILYVPFP